MTAATNNANTRSLVSRILWPHDPRLYAAGFQQIGQSRERFLRILDTKRFNWQVFAVAASGFLTDSYNLFASNVVLPALFFIYNPRNDFAFAFNVATLAASAFGQLVFGIAADVYGRKALYGIELIIVIISTIGLLQCSLGYQDPSDDGHHTWSITGWIIFWRCIMGFGIGAEYPLSAVIAAEWSSTQSRGRMMSAVFLMQPIGQLCAYGAGLTALRAFPGDDKVAMDKFWRYVIAIGVIPTIIALTFRITMPESARWHFDVIRVYGQRSDTDASNETNHDNGGQRLHGSVGVPTNGTNHEADVPDTGASIGPPTNNVGNDDDDADDQHVRLAINGSIDDLDDLPDDEEPYARTNLSNGVWRQFHWQELYNYFTSDRQKKTIIDSFSMIWPQRWITLASASMAWLLLDIVFYGLGFNSPGTLAKLWAPGNLTFQGKSTPWWLRNSYIQADMLNVTFSNGYETSLPWNGTFPQDVFATPLIREVLYQNMVRAIETVSIASIVGSILMIALINRQNRKTMLTVTFLLLSAILFALFGSFTSLFHKNQTHDVLIFFWIVISFLFSFGPNTLTFIIPAEVFPTKYRCTFYGIAAASGKVGSVIAQGLVYTTNGESVDADPAATGGNSPKIRWLLLGFAICMLFGAFFSLFLPPLQERSHVPPHRIENHSLEYLALTEHEKGLKQRAQELETGGAEMSSYQAVRGQG